MSRFQDSFVKKQLSRTCEAFCIELDEVQKQRVIEQAIHYDYDETNQEIINRMLRIEVFKALKHETPFTFEKVIEQISREIACIRKGEKPTKVPLSNEDIRNRLIPLLLKQVLFKKKLNLDTHVFKRVVNDVFIQLQTMDDYLTDVNDQISFCHFLVLEHLLFQLKIDVKDEYDDKKKAIEILSLIYDPPYRQY